MGDPSGLCRWLVSSPDVGVHLADAALKGKAKTPGCARARGRAHPDTRSAGRARKSGVRQAARRQDQ
jgi:hypothetical protein